MAVTCRHHCHQGCNRHFASLAAFDAHRRGPFAGRYCAEPDERFSSSQGICRNGEPLFLGPIWSLAGDSEGVGTGFATEALPGVCIHGKTRVVVA
jgi:hypothetical protein